MPTKSPEIDFLPKLLFVNGNSDIQRKQHSSKQDYQLKYLIFLCMDFFHLFCELFYFGFVCFHQNRLQTLDVLNISLAKDKREDGSVDNLSVTQDFRCIKSFSHLDASAVIQSFTDSSNTLLISGDPSLRKKQAKSIVQKCILILIPSKCRQADIQMMQAVGIITKPVSQVTKRSVIFSFPAKAICQASEGKNII